MCGASGADVGSMLFPVGTVLGGVYGAALGYYLSLNYFLPYLNALTVENILDELKVDENLTEEKQYENSLDKLNLNMNSSNKLIKTARRNYLLAFQKEKIKDNIDLQKQLMKLERSYRIIQNYRQNKGIWD